MPGAAGPFSQTRGRSPKRVLPAAAPGHAHPKVTFQVGDRLLTWPLAPTTCLSVSSMSCTQM